MDARIVMSQVHVVTPASPASPRWNYQLTNLDLININPEYHELVLFFRNCISPNHGERELLDSLKSSLSRVLVEFPVLAGRLYKGEATPSKLEVDVNCQGVHFIESRSDARLDDWSDMRQCPMAIDFSLARSIGDLFQAPLMQVQVTTFRCGGVAIGFHFLHMIMDGYTMVNFLTTWGEIHRGGRIKTRPSFTTSILKARTPPFVDIPVPFIVDNAQPDAAGFHFSNEEHESMVLTMDRNAIDTCVREIEASKSNYGRVTSFEAVSALLWSSITRAKGIPEDLDTAYMLPINLRGKGRFLSGIPDEYFGNALVPCQAYAARAGEIINDKSIAAKLIHERIVSSDQRCMRSAIDWLELNSSAALPTMLHWKRGLLSTSLGSFPIYKIDFGWLGGPLAQLTLLPTALPPSFVALFPAPEKSTQRGIDIHIRLPSTHKNKLLNDVSFTRYFHDKEIISWSKTLCRKALKMAK